jgi:hypothetical protein
MISPAYVRRSALAIMLALAALLVVTAGASAATNTLAWGPSGPITTSAEALAGFVSITCSSPGDCVAAGRDANLTVGEGSGAAAFAVEHNGEWGTPVLLGQAQLPMGAAPADMQNTTFTSIACSSVTSCVAVGSYFQDEESSLQGEAMTVPITITGATGVASDASEVTLPASADGALDQNAVLNGVSCEASGCEAVGQYQTADNVEPMIAAPGVGGVWTATKANTTTLPNSSEGANTTSVLNAISCPPSGEDCEAVGTYSDAAGNLYPWAVQVQVNTGTAHTPEAIALPSDFVAQPAPAESPQQPMMTEISCPSADACTAAGAYETSPAAIATQAFAVPITTEMPGKVSEISTDSQGAEVTGLSCTDAGDCIITGESAQGTTVGFFATETEGAWATAAPVGSSATTLQALDCLTVTNCVGFGTTLTPTLIEETSFFAALPALAVVTSSLPAATVGVPYSATLQETGGSGVSNWSVSNGVLPAGLTLDAATGVISGTPATAGSNGFILTDTDPGPPSQTETASLFISVAAAPLVTTTPPSSGTTTTPGTTTTTPGTTTTAPVSGATQTTPVGTAAATPSATAKLVKVSAKGMKVSVTVSCSDAACKGSLALTTVEHLTGSKVTAVTARAGAVKKKTKPKTKTVTLVKGNYSVAVGKSATVTLTLKGASAKLLTTRHSLPAKLTLTPTGSKTATASKNVSLKAVTVAKKTRKKHSHYAATSE